MDLILTNPIAIQRRRLWAPWLYLVAATLTGLVFIADLLLPRGATAAIGYCAVPVILGGSRRALVGTILCTVLTVVGYWWETPGAAAWMSVFDRTMVAGVLWLTFVLVKRRAVFIDALLEQTEQLRTIAAELRRSNADLERFASRAAHDLRGPLGSVGLLAQLLGRSDSVKDDAEATECVESITSELRRMSDFIQSLLVYGRAGAHEIEPVECDCQAVVKNVQRSLLAEIDRQGARITCDPLPRVRADSVLLGELFQNLIENSLKYRGDAAPVIHISATPQMNGSWLFAVRDNGIGIREEDRGQVFVPFRQGGAHKSSTSGVGLGLATCKRIVERHGGRIWVESSVGQGATFFFTLAKSSAQPTALSPRQ